MMIRSLLVVLGLGAALLGGYFPTQAGAAEKPAAVFAKAYQATRAADVAYEADKWDLATQHYTAGLKHLEHLQATWPNWFPDRVQARIDHCRFQLRQSSAAAKLPVKTPATASKPVAVPPAPAPAKPVVKPAPAPENPAPRAMYDEAYQLAKDGDQSLAVGDKALAAHQYNSAVKILRNLRFEFPTWQPELIDLRLSHCLLQLRKTK